MGQSEKSAFCLASLGHCGQKANGGTRRIAGRVGSVSILTCDMAVSAMRERCNPEKSPETTSFQSSSNSHGRDGHFTM